MFIDDAFFVFGDIINKTAAGWQIIHQSREPVNYFISRHHFTMGIAGLDFNCMTCLELGGEAYMLLAQKTLKITRTTKSHKISQLVTQPPSC